RNKNAVLIVRVRVEMSPNRSASIILEREGRSPSASKFARGEIDSCKNHRQQTVSTVPESKSRPTKSPQGGDRPLEKHPRQPDGGCQPAVSTPERIACHHGRQRQKEGGLIIPIQKIWVTLANGPQCILGHPHHGTMARAIPIKAKLLPV